MAVTANYETVMVVTLKKGEEAIQSVVERFKTLIEQNATLKNVDEWGKRKLAYLINKESEGYYVLFEFESEAAFPAELDRKFRINEDVIRGQTRVCPLKSLYSTFAFILSCSGFPYHSIIHLLF